MVVSEGERIVATTTAIAALDVATSMAMLANSRGYTRPILHPMSASTSTSTSTSTATSGSGRDSLIMHIEHGRHPIVEAAQADQGALAATFVGNDSLLTPEVFVIIIIIIIYFPLFFCIN
jgi:DNA mismatch repair ATPase MutS